MFYATKRSCRHPGTTLCQGLLTRPLMKISRMKKTLVPGFHVPDSPLEYVGKWLVRRAVATQSSYWAIRDVGPYIRQMLVLICVKQLIAFKESLHFLYYCTYCYYHCYEKENHCELHNLIFFKLLIFCCLVLFDNAKLQRLSARGVFFRFFRSCYMRQWRLFVTNGRNKALFCRKTHVRIVHFRNPTSWHLRTFQQLRKTQKRCE